MDIRIYFLIIPFALLFAYFDPTIGKVLGQWLIGFPVLIGLAMAVRKVIFHIDLHSALEKACETPQGAAMVVLSVSIVMASVILAGVVWLSL